MIRDLFSQIPQFLLGSFVTLFVTYYLLRNAQALMLFSRALFPLSRAQFNAIIERFNGLCRGMVISQAIIAVIQGVLVSIAALILGLDNVVLIGLITIVFAVIPFMGATLVWWSILAYLVFGLNEGVLVWKPWFMLLYGTLVISSVDNIIRPKLLADSAQINPAIVLVGFIGGFLLFGLPGIFLGPLILSMAELALEIYKQEKL
jgi:predicted PurR-regulated permease PerM